MLMIRSLLLGCSCTLLLTACGPPPNMTPVGSPTPGPTIPPITIDAPPAMANLQILVSEMDTDLSVKPIVGAAVEISSVAAAPQTVRSNSSGIATFNNLRLDLELLVQISAKGYLPVKRQVNLQTLGTKSGSAISLSVPLEAERLSYTGQVTTSNGAALSDAVIFDGQQSALSDAQGQFRLARSHPETFVIRITRQGYQPQTRSVTVTNSEAVLSVGNIPLPASTTPVQLIVDATKRPLGLSADEGMAILSQLTAALASEKYQVQTQKGSKLENLAQAHILLTLSPSQAYSTEEQKQVQEFVNQGGKLVVLGEWSGFGGFNAKAMNQMLSPMGVQFGEDLLRENKNGFLNLQSFVPHFMTQGLTSLKLFQSCSVTVSAAAQGQAVARTGAKTFRIADTGAFGAIVAAAHGSGKVILIGDTSMWLDQDSDSSGQANFTKGDNRKLALQVMAW